MIKLYLVHCGFYDKKIGNNIFEFHTNLFIAASSFEDAKLKIKTDPMFKKKKMHIDGIVEINEVSGYKIALKKSGTKNKNNFNFFDFKSLRAK